MFSQKEKAVIYDAFDMYYAEYCKTIPSNEELGYITFTKEFKEKMEKLIERERKFYFYWINTVGKRVAVIILAILICFTTVTFSVKALREPFVSFIVETFERYTNVIFVSDKYANDKIEHFKKITPKYIPEGYVKDSEVDGAGFCQVMYFNLDGLNYILYTQNINDATTIQANTQGVEYDNIYINDYEGIIYSNKGVSTIIFGTEQYAISIDTTLPREELIKIAESIDFK